MGIAEIQTFFALVAVCISPVPALPFIIDTYSRFSFIVAATIVYSAVVTSSILIYTFFRVFTKKRYTCFLGKFASNRFKNNKYSRKTRQYLKRISRMSTMQLYALLQSAIIPAKIMFAGCGMMQISARRFIPALMMANIFSQIFYWVLGASASKIENELNGLGLGYEIVLRLLVILVVALVGISVKRLIETIYKSILLNYKMPAKFKD